MAVGTIVVPVLNQTNLEKIESFMNDATYKEALESSSNFNTRLCLERRMRVPFLDSQTCVAQNHSQLFMSKRQRIPGLNPGQIYSYPRPRWRKRRRQYLSLNSRAFVKAADAMLDGEGDLHSISQVENPAMQDTDSKDSQLLKDEVSKEWFYDDTDMLEIEGYDEPDADSDFDYEESAYSKRRSKGSRKYSSRGRGGIDSPSTPSRRGKGGGRGRKKATPSYEPVPGDTDKPFACERTPGRRGRHPANPSQVQTPHSGSNPPQPIPNTTQQPPSLQPPNNTTMSSNTDEPPMPVLIPEKLTGPSAPPARLTSDLPVTIEQPPDPLADKPKAAPSPYCDFCLGDARENKKTLTSEELVSCSDCGRSGHPTCLQFTANMIISVCKYRWQCIECKCCSVCGNSDNDDQLLFCDDCDRGYHMYCLAPALTTPPEGSWSCKLCIAQFHK